MKKRPNLSEAKRALRLFASEYAPRDVRHANARKWLRSVAFLGSRWVLAGREEVKWGNGGSAP